MQRFGALVGHSGFQLVLIAAGKNPWKAAVLYSLEKKTVHSHVLLNDGGTS